VTTSVFRTRAPAKINLTLEVVARRADGFHDIRSVFLRLDALADRLVVRIADQGRSRGIDITTTSSVLPVDAANICHRAASAYLARTGHAAALGIAIDKRIPIAAGLGGGSSDAAAVLLALNRHFRSLPARELERLGSEVGKDVPFFLRGHAASNVAGTGDVLAPVRRVPGLHVLVVNPGVAVGTADAYRALDATAWYMDHRARANRSHAMIRALASRDLPRIAARLYNDFEPAIERAHPIVREVKQALVAFGAAGALMTGSGPTVFGLFATRPARALAQRTIVARYPGLAICAA
jgi:4-diphosphocytidyl-2-C-methyl-D-erythritol kinase